MNVITATEFRNNQRKYFDLAEIEPVFIIRAGKSPIALTPVSLEDYPSKSELEAIREGLEAFQRGDYAVIKDIENIWESIQ